MQNQRFRVSDVLTITQKLSLGYEDLDGLPVASGNINEMRKNNVLYIMKALLSISSEWHLAEQQNAVPDLLPSQENNAYSKNKGNE